MVLNSVKCHSIYFGKNSENEKALQKKTYVRKALSSLTNYLNDSEEKLIFNATVKSQFNYCPLVWMFCSRQTSNVIKTLHEGALRLVLNDHFSDFEALLRKGNDV